jgi:hypothetical protein
VLAFFRSTTRSNTDGPELFNNITGASVHPGFHFRPCSSARRSTSKIAAVGQPNSSTPSVLAGSGHLAAQSECAKGLFRIQSAASTEDAPDAGMMLGVRSERGTLNLQTSPVAAKIASALPPN